MTDLEQRTHDYWRAASIVRLCAGDVRDRFAARAVLLGMAEHGESQALRNAARQVCLTHGICARGFTLHTGGAA